MTLKVLESGIDLTDVKAIAGLARTTKIRLVPKEGSFAVELDGADVTEKIRTPKVTSAVSAVSMIAEVRKRMVQEQRAMGKNGAIVLEGRDIGTVVFPDADLKIFMVAHQRERAARRGKEMAAKGMAAEIDELEKEIVERDKKDTTRSISPLTKANNAIVLDTTDLTIEDQVEFIVKKAKEILK